MSKRARQISRAHKLLGLVVGAQLLFWTLSGFYFTLFPIETIRGEHLRAGPQPIDMAALEDASPPQLDAALTKLEVRRVLGEPVWLATGETGASLYDFETGEPLMPFEEAHVREIALESWRGRGEIVSAELVETPPREAGSSSPLWRVDFDGQDKATFWIDASRGEVQAVRTGKWRLFDVLWRFHIMDITGEDRFDSWWLKLAAFLGLTTVLFGIALLVQRALRGRLLK